MPTAIITVDRNLNRSSAIRCFECSDAIEIHDRIIFDFYTRLPHICKITIQLTSMGLTHIHPSHV